MKKVSTFCISFLLLLSTCFAQTLVVPGTYTSTIGAGTFLGPLANASRAYQMLINENQLTAMVGKQITAIAFRSPTSGTVWPTAITTFPNFDIYIGTSVAPASRSLTMPDNAVGTQTQVRSGPLVIGINEYPAGGENSWGRDITFTTPYTYTGGHLLVEIRHPASDGTSKSNDAILTTNTSAGYATAFSACWSSVAYGTTPTTGSNGNFCVPMFKYSSTAPVTITKFQGERKNKTVSLNWQTATETNSQGFALERSANGRDFTSIASINSKAVNGTSNQQLDYTFEDMQALASSCYYRLKQIDKDGHYTYSSIVAIKGNKASGLEIAIAYPNPVAAVLNMVLASATAQKTSITITDMNGKTLINKTSMLIEGDNQLQVDVSQLPSGTYLLNASNADGKLATTVFTKQ